MSDNEHEPSADKVIHLIAQHRITSHDANFIALAMEMGVLYVTEDGELHEKFPTIAIGMKDSSSKTTAVLSFASRERPTEHPEMRGKKIAKKDRPG